MRKVLTVSLLGSLLFVLGSCGGNGARSFVRIVNASPDAGALDISIGGTTLTNVAYATGSNYFTMAPGSSIAFKVNQHGQTATPLNTQITLTDKTYYTIAVVGLVGSSTAVPPVPSTITIAQSVDDHSTAAAGDVKIRVLQADPYFAVPNSGKVDVYVGDPTANLNGTIPNFSGVSFPSMASFVSFTVPTTNGLLRIRVAPAGDTNPDADSFLDTGTAGTLFKALQSRTFVILDAPPAGSNQFQGIFLNDLN
jgi:hypothetical protein